MKLYPKVMSIKLLSAFMVSLIPAYCIKAYSTYSSFKRHNEDYLLSQDFFINILGYMWSDFEITLKFLDFILMLFPLYPVYLLYFYVFYKVIKTDSKKFLPYQDITITLLFVLFHCFCFAFSDIIASY